VHGVAPGLASYLEDLLGVEIRRRPEPGERPRVVRSARVERLGVIGGVHGDRADVHLGGGPRDSHGDLAPVGDEQALHGANVLPHPALRGRRVALSPPA
jgi:hypothetical protein